MTTPEHGTGTAANDGEDIGSDAAITTIPPTHDTNAELHLRLLAAGIPVVVCKPHQHRGACKPECQQELSPPSGWSRITVEQARAGIAAYRPGTDTLAMVGGHGIDVLDIDAKAGGDLAMVPEALQHWGRTRTPSGGWHVPVPSTGYGKGDLFIERVYQGDYVGGTALGGARLLCFLPGSTRPKYPGGGYVEERSWDVPALVTAEPPALLLDLCKASNLSMTAGPAKPAATARQVCDFVALHTPADPYDQGAARCGYGHTALTRMIDEVCQVVAGDQHRGRHVWAVRSVMRVTELIAAGCLTSLALALIEQNFAAIKPGSDHEMTELQKYAVANVTAKTRCEVHGG